MLHWQGIGSLLGGLGSRLIDLSRQAASPMPMYIGIAVIAVLAGWVVRQSIRPPSGN